MRAQHINVKIPVDLKARMDEESKREHAGRRRRLKVLLTKGYREIAGEASKIIKDFNILDDEALQH